MENLMKRFSATEIVLMISLMGHGFQLIGKFLPPNQPAFAASSHSSEIIVKEKCTGRTGGTK